jgi:ammonia channel protein AmtB
MSAVTVVAVIWLIVFVIGVVVGVIAIIALSTLRKERRSDDPDDNYEDRWPEREHGVSGIPGRWEGGQLTRWPQGPADDDTP